MCGQLKLLLTAALSGPRRMLTLASRYSWDSSTSTFSVTLPALGNHNDNLPYMHLLPVGGWYNVFERKRDGHNLMFNAPEFAESLDIFNKYATIRNIA